MNTHLPSTKTFVYTIERNKERQQRITDMLVQMGFSDWQFVYGKQAQPYWMGIHNDWVRMLETPPPFLILEDDAVVAPYYVPTVDYPDDAQLVYLGGTANGHFYNAMGVKFSKGPAGYPYRMAYTEYSNKFIRVYNMHSTHAVLFVDQQTTTDFMHYIARRPQNAVDTIFAMYAHKYRMYCVKHPYWYQKDGHNEGSTLNYYP